MVKFYTWRNELNEKEVVFKPAHRNLVLPRSVPLPAVPQVAGSGHLQVLRARAAHLLHAGLLEDNAVGAALPPVPAGR